MPPLVKRTALLVLVLASVSALFTMSAAGDKKQPPSRPINLNAATIKELQELPGIGLVTAKAIVQFRQKSGPFHRVEDLLAIRGISEGKLSHIRPYVTVAGTPPATTHATPVPARHPAPPTAPTKQ